MSKPKPIDLQQFVRPGLTYTEICELYDAFNLFDTDHSGTVSKTELKQALQQLNYGGAQTNTLVLNLFDTVHSTQLTFKQFVDLLTGTFNDAGSRAGVDYSKLFALFDHDNSGYITLTDMKRVCGELGETLSDGELNEMLERADTDGDGQISLSEFTKMMTHKFTD